MESRPELTKAEYAEMPYVPNLTGIDAHSLRDIQRIKAKFDTENDAFVHTTTTKQLSTFTALWYVAKNLPTLWKLYSLYKEAKMLKNWKTSLSSIIGALVVIVRLFGVEIPQPVSDGLLALALFLVGLFAKDAESK
jgi:VIT1/CCC1 family predicted Fe2+/Mn2+ transporter